jgi:hypothetical protein
MKRFVLFAIAFQIMSSTAFATVIDYYRFENNLTDSGTGAHNATVLAGSPTFSSTVPAATIPQTELSDTKSLSMATSDALLFSYAFPFDTLTNATLEFYIDPSSVSSEGDVFWTTTGSGDQNRFNIGISAGGGVFVDYRDNSGNPGALHLSLGSAGTIAANQWSFVAIVKSGNSYSIYLNNLSPVTIVDSSPNLPTSTGWTINGRATEQPSSCCQFSGLIDEVRISDQALSPSQFLNRTPSSSVPEPASIALLGLGVIVFLAKRISLSR